MTRIVKITPKTRPKVRADGDSELMKSATVAFMVEK